MGRFKVIDDGYVLGIGINQSPIDEITQKEYDELTDIFRNKPTAPEGYHYLLRADTLEWELVEIPPEPDEPEVNENE